MARLRALARPAHVHSDAQSPGRSPKTAGADTDRNRQKWTRTLPWKTAVTIFIFAPPLVKLPGLHYRLPMSLKKHFILLALLLSGWPPAFADVIQLKDQAAVTGKILAEKPDS